MSIDPIRPYMDPNNACISQNHFEMLHEIESKLFFCFQRTKLMNVASL